MATAPKKSTNNKTSAKKATPTVASAEATKPEPVAEEVLGTVLGIPATEEEETAVAEEKNTNVAHVQYSEADVQAMIAKAVADALAAQKAQQQEVHTPSNDGLVTLRFYDEINDANVIYLGENGKYGQIIGKRWTGQIPKMAFIGDFRTPHIQKLLEDRNMIVIDGLTDEERKLYGVDYVKGEFLDEKMYSAMLRMPEDDLVATYTGLCPEWKRMVAVRFAEAYEAGKLRVTRDALLALNRESRKANKVFDQNDPRRKGDFHQIIDKMNLREQEDDVE